MIRISKVDEAIDILRTLGLPDAQQNERSALTLLALADLKKDTPWCKAKKRIIKIHDILIFIKKHYKKQYAENTRETIRRQTLHQFEQAGIVVKNPDDKFRPTNSPKTAYAITEEALDLIRNYGTADWQCALDRFLREKGNFSQRKGQC